MRDIDLLKSVVGSTFTNGYREADCVIDRILDLLREGQFEDRTEAVLYDIIKAEYAGEADWGDE